MIEGEPHDVIISVPIKISGRVEAWDSNKKGAFRLMSKEVILRKLTKEEQEDKSCRVG